MDEPEDWLAFGCMGGGFAVGGSRHGLRGLHRLGRVVSLRHRIEEERLWVQEQFPRLQRT